MKNVLLAITVCMGLATTAMAGDPGPAPMPEPFDVAAPEATWTGFYAGGLVSFDGGDIGAYTLSGVLLNSPQLNNTTAFGGFVGYNKQVNAMVYGGELAYTSGDIVAVGFPASMYQDRIDVKARIGYSFGRTMVYGVVGYSWANFVDVTTDFPSTGLNYGVGVDVMVTDRLFFGAEYLMRDLSGTSTLGRLDGNVNSATIRAGIKF